MYLFKNPLSFVLFIYSILFVVTLIGKKLQATATSGNGYIPCPLLFSRLWSAAVCLQDYRGQCCQSGPVAVAGQPSPPGIPRVRRNSDLSRLRGDSGPLLPQVSDEACADLFVSGDRGSTYESMNSLTQNG